MIIIIQTAFLGDLILSIPAIQKIRNHFPHKKLGIVCKKGLGSFLLKYQVCDQVFEIEKSNRTSYLQHLKSINQNQIQAVFCFHRSVRSQLFAWQIKAQRKYGFHSLLGSLVFSSTVSYFKRWPEVIRYMALVGLVDPGVKRFLALVSAKYLETYNFYGSDGKFLPIPELLKFTQSDYQQTPVNPKKIVIFPGSVWATKMWTEKGFTDLISEFKNMQLEVFLLGSDLERELCERISKAAGHGIVKAGSMKIEESIEFIKDALFVVCNDSASAHMAAFVSRPAFVIFGPTTLQLGFRPWNDESRVIEKNLKCRPCGAHGHNKCPLGHHDCMKMIKADDVLSSIRSSGLLNKFSN